MNATRPLLHIGLECQKCLPLVRTGKGIPERLCELHWKNQRSGTLYVDWETNPCSISREHWRTWH